MYEYVVFYRMLASSWISFVLKKEEEEEERMKKQTFPINNGFEILTAAQIKITVSGDLAPCSLVYPLREYTASHPRRL